MFLEGHTVTGCGHCERVARVKQGGYGPLIWEREHSIAVVGDHQFFKGYGMVISKHHIREMHAMPAEVSAALFQDVLELGCAIEKAYKPWKINYASLGNVDEHLHWHVMPRYEDDPDKRDHPWKNSARFGDFTVTAEDIMQVKEHLRRCGC